MSIFKMQAKLFLGRVELRFALTIGFLIIAIAFMETCARFYGADIGALPSAAYGWAWNMDAMQINAMRVLAFFLIFIISASVFADNYLADTKSRATIYVAIRCRLSCYIMSNALLTFIGGFIVILLPLIFSQLMAFLVFPLDGSFAGRLNTPVYVLLPTTGVIFPDLTFNHPYLSNLVFIIYTSFWAGTMSLFSFALSLFFKKSRLLIIALPTVLLLLVWQLTPFLKTAFSYIPYYYFYPSSGEAGLNPVYFFGAPIAFLAISIFFILYAYHSKKDVLL